MSELKRELLYNPIFISRQMNSGGTVFVALILVLMPNSNFAENFYHPLQIYLDFTKFKGTKFEVDLI